MESIKICVYRTFFYILLFCEDEMKKSMYTWFAFSQVTKRVQQQQELTRAKMFFLLEFTLWPNLGNRKMLFFYGADAFTFQKHFVCRISLECLWEFILSANLKYFVDKGRIYWFVCLRKRLSILFIHIEVLIAFLTISRSDSSQGLFFNIFRINAEILLKN